MLAFKDLPGSPTKRKGYKPEKDKNRLQWTLKHCYGSIDGAVGELYNVCNYYRLVRNKIVHGGSEDTEYSLDTLLVTFINQCATNMDYSLIKNNFGDETAEQFFDSIAVNDDIDNEKYKNILCSLEYSFDSYDLAIFINRTLLFRLLWVII